MIKAEEIYEKFCQDWSKISFDLSWEGSSKLWTKKILQYFFNEGVKRDFKPYTNSNIIKEGIGEYMVDLCWCKEDEKSYAGLELTLESEWGPSEKEVLGDFYKLVDIKSYLKVMITAVRYESEIDGIIKKLSKVVSDGKIKIPEEEYLIIVFSRDKNRPNKEQIAITGFQINNNGNYNRLPDYRFADGIST